MNIPPSLRFGLITSVVKSDFKTNYVPYFYLGESKSIYYLNRFIIGRIQTFLLKSVKFFNLEKFSWSCDSSCEVSSILKIWAPLALTSMIYWPKCPSTSFWENYPKKKINSKTDKCTRISIQNFRTRVGFSQIGCIFVVKMHAEIQFF